MWPKPAQNIIISTNVQHMSGVGTICEHAMKKCLKSSGARAIQNFAGKLQIAEIERRQFYFWPKHKRGHLYVCFFNQFVLKPLCVNLLHMSYQIHIL